MDYRTIEDLPGGLSELEFWEPGYDQSWMELDGLTAILREETWTRQTDYYEGLEQMWTRRGAVGW